MVKRSMVFVLGLLVAGLAFGSAAEESGAGTSGAEELTYWFAASDLEVAFIQAAVDEYNAQSSGPVIKLVERPNSNEAMATAIAGGQGPDILHYNHNTVWFFGLDSIYDLKEFVLDDEIGLDSESFMPSARRSVNYGGKVIALPMNFGLGAVMYNARLIEEAGLDTSDPPQTWAEFEEWAKALTIREGEETVQWGVTADSVDWLLQEVMFANGGDWNNDDMSEYAPTKEELIGGVAWIDRLVNELEVMPIPRGVTWTGTSQMLAGEQGFENEAIAMKIGSSGFSGELAMNPDLRIGLFPIPRGPMAGDTVRISTGYNGLHVMFNSADPRESYLFMKWLVENKASDYAIINTSFPAYAGNLDLYRNDPTYAAMVDHLLKSPVRRFHVFPARLDVRSQEPSVVENVLLGRLTPRESVERFKEHADRVFSENRAELDEFISIQELVW
jgi:sn-glycerol 3-phosphate transport system substrate-binding protein